MFGTSFVLNGRKYLPTPECQGRMPYVQLHIAIAAYELLNLLQMRRPSHL
jgi:hypothetical protein